MSRYGLSAEDDRFLTEMDQSEEVGTDAAPQEEEDNQSYGDEIQMTSKQVLDALQHAWMNEKLAVQILPYEEPIVDMVLIRIRTKCCTLRTGWRWSGYGTEKRLSAGELQFATDFYKSQMAVRHMPRSFQDDETFRKVVPNLDSHVFVRAKENEAKFSISADHETINVAAGSVHMFKYRDVEPLVLEGIVELI
ncbi:SLD5 [Culex quinquefasciatus]|uniref:DNA replication complex GINS protein SLD5 n=1 Tax=Culex quinquefasciatus TaxID=7176 RepID=B0W2P3_CULQU|nr:SLD5 [Culex quinquefasciatus]EDS43149.1 SLD5 [Culex quinquefasciatus]|eukprot:XP_001842962.1 SLD5 [Culex quinquefasciatus]